MGQGFQFVGGAIFPLTPDGVVPLAKDDASPLSSVDEAFASRALVVNAASPTPARQSTAPKNVAQERPMTPKDVVKLARARLREVDREIKRLQALQSEREQLRRLLAAADGKPVGIVRELPKKSAG